MCRAHSVDAHLLTSEDVDCRSACAVEALCPSAYAIQSGTSLEFHRYGLHEPAPGCTRRSRIRIHHFTAAPGAKGHSWFLERQRSRQGIVSMGSCCVCLARIADAEGSPFRR